MMEVVRAELYCVHSRMENIRTKLRDSESNQEGAESELSRLMGGGGWGGRGFTP